MSASSPLHHLHMLYQWKSQKVDLASMDQEAKVPVFLPLLKNGQFHLFSLSGHKPELRHQVRNMFSRIKVSKFSYKERTLSSDIPFKINPSLKAIAVTRTGLSWNVYHDLFTLLSVWDSKLLPLPTPHIYCFYLFWCGNCRHWQTALQPKLCTELLHLLMKYC